VAALDEKLVSAVVEEICKSLSAGHSPAGSGKRIPLEVSARHIHLSDRDVEALFGAGCQLTPKRSLSQPGQFLCEERVRLVGLRNEIGNVAVLGPPRGKTQIELSLTDARFLGVDAPLRMSGELCAAAGLVIVGGVNCISAADCAIIAKSHIHMTPEDALFFSVQDAQSVRVKVHSARPITLEDVVVRVDKSFALAMHIDFDEANACMAADGVFATIEGSGGECGLVQERAPAVHSGMEITCGERLITESVAKRLAAQGEKEIVLKSRAIITPLASDVFRAAKITVRVGDVL